MKKIDIFYSALVVTALSINPLLFTSLNASITHTTKTNTLSYSVAKILHTRGIEEDSAHRLAKDFFSDKEAEFAFMLDNFLNRCDLVSKDDVMDYISTLVLHRQTIELDSYASLIKMVHSITKTMPTQPMLKELLATANTNFAYYSSAKIL